MTDTIDQQIQRIEKELAGLRRQKLETLRSEMAALEAALHTNGEKATPAAGKGRRPRAVSAAPAAAKGKNIKKRRGPKRGPRVSDEEVLEKLRAAVQDAGTEGISARAAAQEAGVFYPRALKVMDGNFTKSGSGKWTRYTA